MDAFYTQLLSQPLVAESYVGSIIEERVDLHEFLTIFSSHSDRYNAKSYLSSPEDGAALSATYSSGTALLDAMDSVHMIWLVRWM